MITAKNAITYLLQSITCTKIKPTKPDLDAMQLFMLITQDDISTEEFSKFIHGRKCEFNIPNMHFNPLLRTGHDSPLEFAISRDPDKACIMLQHDDAKVNSSNEYHLLYTAAENKSIKVAKLLLEKGANVNCPNNVDSSKLSHSPLKCAIIRDHTEMVELLLGACKEPLRFGKSALKVAKDYGNEEIISMIKNHLLTYPYC